MPDADADAGPVQALRSLETGLDGWSLPKNWKRMTRQQLEYGLRVPNPERMVVLKQVPAPPQELFLPPQSACTSSELLLHPYSDRRLCPAACAQQAGHSCF